MNIIKKQLFEFPEIILISSTVSKCAMNFNQNWVENASFFRGIIKNMVINFRRKNVPIPI